MNVSRLITVPAWDGRIAEIARAYWCQRGFSVSVDEDGPSLRGERGSPFGTVFPFYWRRDGAGILDVDWRKPEGGMTMLPQSKHDVLIGLDIALFTWPSRETEWAAAYLRLEIAELHHILWGKGDLAEVWLRFARAERRATARWIWTKRLAGRRVSDEWEDEISELEVRLFFAGGDPSESE